MPVNPVNSGRFHHGPAAAAEQQPPAGLRWNLPAVLRTPLRMIPARHRAPASVFQELSTGQLRVSSDRHKPCSHLPTASISARARETGSEGTTFKNPRFGNPKGLTNAPRQIACVSASKPPLVTLRPICHNAAGGFCCWRELRFSSLCKRS